MLDTGSSSWTPQPAELPRLSPWAPVLYRGPGELQVGLGGDNGLVLSGVPDGFEHILRLADGRHTRTDLLTRAIAYQVEPALVDRVLRTLTTAGLIVDHAADLSGQQNAAPAGTGATAEPLGRCQLRIIGAGRLGSAVARAGLRAGIGQLLVADGSPVDPVLYPHAGVATSQAEALVAALPDSSGRGTGSVPVQTVDHWSKPERTPPDLTVIATDYAEPDPAIGRDFVDARHPHLYLRPSQGGAVIGPFVQPGDTPCLRCIDLTRRDADPAWPTMLPQLCRTAVPVTALLASWAAVTAITQIVAVIAGRSPSTLSGTVELTPRQSEPQFRRWPRHPQCSCAELDRR